MTVTTKNEDQKVFAPGQRWRRRDGGYAHIASINPGLTSYPIRGVATEEKASWTLEGYFNSESQLHDYDLVELVSIIEPLSPTVAMDVHSTAEQIAALAAMAIVGYETLAEVLREAYAQAAVGKGHERHSHGEPFDRQVMADMARRFGVGALLAQAFKKSEESQRLGDERGIKELLGAINYLAGAVIAIRRQRMEEGLA